MPWRNSFNWQSKPRRARTERSAARQLTLEPLEDRRMLAVFTVSNLSDGTVNSSGDLPGSLRQAIFDANGNEAADTIEFSVAGKINILSELPTISDELIINGANQITIDAGRGTDGLSNTGDGYRIFTIFEQNAPFHTVSTSVELNGLTLTGGDVSATETLGSGGVIFNYEILTIADSLLVGNSAIEDGGAIFNNFGTLNIVRSTLSGNIAGNSGGAINNNYGTVRINSSTLSNNSADFGGAVDGGPGPSLQLFNSTVSGNSAVAGGGIFGLSGPNISSSTITDNTATSSGGGIYSAFPLSLTGSIVSGNTAPENSNVSGELYTDLNNFVGADALLGPLADNGGPTLTHALLPGSPALDAGFAPAHIYELQNSLVDLRGGPTLVDYGGTFTAGGYQFGPNQGFDLVAPNIPAGDYSIEIEFTLDAPNGASVKQKIIDFSNLGTDSGLVVNDGMIYHSVGVVPLDDISFSYDQPHHLVFARFGTSDQLVAYLDGFLIWASLSGTNQAVLDTNNPILRFFQDDTTTNQTEAGSGLVTSLRVYDRFLGQEEVTRIYGSDQRGGTRERLSGKAMDIGAFEAQADPSADFDADGDIDGADFLTWQRGFGTSDATSADGNSDDDTDVDSSDLAAWQASFGQLEPAPALNGSLSTLAVQPASKLVNVASAGESLGQSTERSIVPIVSATEAIDLAFSEDDQFGAFLPFLFANQLADIASRMGSTSGAEPEPLPPLANEEDWRPSGESSLTIELLSSRQLPTLISASS